MLKNASYQNQNLTPNQQTMIYSTELNATRVKVRHTVVSATRPTTTKNGCLIKFPFYGRQALMEVYDWWNQNPFLIQNGFGPKICLHQKTNLDSKIFGPGI